MMVSGTMVDRWLRSAVQDMKENNRTEVLCPCRKCKGIVWLDPHDDGRVEAHLLMTGFMDGYTRWIIEDEDDDVEDADGAGNDDTGQDEEMIDNGGGEEAGHGGGEGAGHGGGEGAGHGGGENDMDSTQQSSSVLSSIVRDPHVQALLRKETSTERAASREEAKLEQLVVDSNTPLYDGCNPEVTRLSFTLQLLKTKAKNKWTDTSLDEHLKYLKDVLPAGNLCPTSVDEAKKIVCPLDLPHVRYHACINDCIIYRKEHAEKTSCPVCNASRYKKAGKKCPQKVVWYLPITPRLQRYFVDPKEAKLMRWHAERKKPDDGDDPKLRHVKDGSQWRALNSFYRYFECDARNIVLGACTDGMNPFGNQNTNHSTWPVFVWMYNLPPGCA